MTTTRQRCAHTRPSRHTVYSAAARGLVNGAWFLVPPQDRLKVMGRVGTWQARLAPKRFRCSTVRTGEFAGWLAVERVQ